MISEQSNYFTLKSSIGIGCGQSHDKFYQSELDKIECLKQIEIQKEKAKEDRAKKKVQNQALKEQRAAERLEKKEYREAEKERKRKYNEEQKQLKMSLKKQKKQQII